MINTFEKIIISIVAIITTVFILLAFIGAEKQKEFTEQKMGEIKNCEVIGDALDRKKSMNILRTIYKCPDGTIKIR